MEVTGSSPVSPTNQNILFIPIGGYSSFMFRKDFKSILLALLLGILMVMILGACSDKIEDGPFEHYWENGQILEKGTIKNGVLDGPYVMYYENGQLYQEASYDLDKCVSTSLFFQNGELMAEGQCGTKARFYFSNGALRCAMNYKDFNRHGSSECFYPNGDLSSKENFSNDKKDGKFQYFAPGGYISAEYLWKEGILKEVEFFDSMGLRITDGEVRERHTNGQLSARYKIENGQAEGQFFYYFPDGTLGSIGNYLKSELEGDYRSYHMNGNLAYKTHYKNGLQHGTSTNFALDGLTIIFQEELFEGKPVKNK